jgi:HD superfamily phosphohydrolase
LQYLPRLVSSDIDVDRADFLKRDTHQTGVAYGRFDLDWLISTCTVGKTGGGDLVVGFDEKKAPRVVEQFLMARRALYDTVYHHKTVRSAEGMVGMFLRRLRDAIAEKPSLEAEFTGFVRPLIQMVAGETVGPEDLLSVDDFSLWVLIDYASRMKGMDVTVRDLGQRILGRDLFKLVPCESRKANEFLRKPGSHESLRDAIEPYCAGKKEYYLIVDSASVSMFSESPKDACYFVNDKRVATPAKGHEYFKHHSLETSEVVRVYTIREAVDAVASLIGK